MGKNLPCILKKIIIKKIINIIKGLQEYRNIRRIYFTKEFRVAIAS
ncbi:hypothetical protein SpAn4DRAFT_2720 [Sporomusa ovata]|uniref:Uncharacterized protein n=1 Tax=Sporomusa ovata TaxID=2378 RepID=A0A0U1KXW2_9FIRM|nr:hypothetical protein SpAn4DRAFT_2720 [Sporomusa ovata]